MKKLKITPKHVIILFIAISFFVNYIFYKRVYSGLHRENIMLKSKILQKDALVQESLSSIDIRLKVFNQLKKIEQQISRKKFEIAYLRSKLRIKKDILNIIKTLTLESHITLNKIELKSEKVEKNTGILQFDCMAIGKLNNFLDFLDMIEGANDLLIVDSYNLSPVKDNDNEWNIHINLKSLYLSIKG